ncbi:MAG: DNA helicase RecQ [bacterium]|nr:DNA helicase RecQ [bacterium]
MDRVLDALRQYWGYDGFRPLQGEAMQCVLDHRDSVVVLPTGGGKSLCYQAPVMAMRGMAIVVSPLIALMKDQVDQLRACGIPAACINSSLDADERRAIADDVREDRIKLLYVAPERLVTDRFLEFVRGTRIAYIAIDEAHCISTWGHDFRPEYRGLSVVRDAFPTVGMHAFTATATEQVRGDMVEQLSLRNPTTLVGSFDRPNLVYRVQQRTDAVQQTRAILERRSGESAIVYCIRRKDVDAMASALCRYGCRALPYHAGMSDENRKANQEAFIRDEADVIVATVAFGMGIDKPDVRAVIHAGMPKSVEHYQQESGRAGRDGLEAECWLLYSGADFSVWQRILSELEGEAAEVADVKLRQMFDYCTGIQCRHRSLLSYFGEDYAKPACDACDVCLNEIDSLDEAEDIARQILIGVAQLGESFGGAYVAEFLSGGDSDERIQARGHENLEAYGTLSAHGKRGVRAWIEQLISQELLAKEGEYNVLRLTQEGRDLLEGAGAGVQLTKQAGRAKKRTRAAADSWEGVDEGLFEALREIRREIARGKGVPPYVVFGDAALRDMARLRPSTGGGFLMVRGVGKHKAGQYGDRFTAAIRDYCEAHGLGVDVGIGDTTLALDMGESGSDGPAPRKTKRMKQTDAKDRAAELFAEGRTVEEVCMEVQRAASTVVGYLVHYIQREAVKDPSPWVDEYTVGRIREARDSIGRRGLKAIYQHLEGDVNYGDIRITMACFINEV